jgi:hypothetical protein
LQYFHPTRFKEFEPELRAEEHVRKALAALERCTTESGARVRLHLTEAVRALPDAFSQKEARAELEQRLAGKFVDPADAPAPRSPLELELERERDKNAQLVARLDALEAARAPTA